MNKIDKTTRRRNWPAIERALRYRFGGFVAKENRSATRRYYVDGIKPEYPEAEQWKLRLIVKLLCEPEATHEQWAQWKAEAESESETGILGDAYFQDLYEDQFSFGTNSLFNRRDAQIYAFFFERKSSRTISGTTTKHDKQLLQRQTDAYTKLAFYLGQCSMYLSRPYGPIRSGEKHRLTLL